MASKTPDRTMAPVDKHLLQKARNAANGRKFCLRFDNPYRDSALEREYDTRWNAEVALLANLAFWTQRDPDQMWQLYKQSALYDEKSGMYDQFPEYKKGLIQEALDLTSEVYEPMSTGDEDMNNSAT